MAQWSGINGVEIIPRDHSRGNEESTEWNGNLSPTE